MVDLLIIIGDIVRIGILTYFAYSICKLVISWYNKKYHKRHKEWMKYNLRNKNEKR